MIKWATDKGARFIILTGRVPAIIGELLDQIELDKSDDEYYIAANGALIMTTSGKILYKKPLNKEKVYELAEYFMEADIDAFACVSMDAYNFLKDKTGVQYGFGEDLLSLSMDEVKERFKDADFYKMYVMTEGASIFPELSEKISVISEGQIRGVPSSLHNMEVFDGSTSKGKTLKIFCEMMGTNIKDALAIGDHYNDKEMLEAAGHTACPANALDEIKAMCEYVSPYTCEEGAVADIIKHFLSE